MKVLFCGGIKTENIIKSLRTRFSSGSVEFLAETSIENIESLINKGSYFDRIVIIEQSWTDDGKISDEVTMRNKINNFVKIFKQRYSGVVECLIVATTKDMAQIALEETIEIINESIIILKEPPYAVSFFSMVSTSNMHEIPENMIYKMGEQNEIIDIEKYFDTTTNKYDTEEEIEIDDNLELGDKLEDIAESVEISEYTKLKDNADEELDVIQDIDDDIFGNVTKACDIEEYETENNIGDNIECKDEHQEVNRDDNEEEIIETSEQEIDIIEEDEYIEEEEQDNLEYEENTENKSIENTQEHIDEESDNNIETLEISEFNGEDNIEIIKITKSEQEILQVFNEDIYKKKDNRQDKKENKPKINKKNKDMGVSGPTKNELITLLNTLSTRGSSLVVTGAGGCGTSTIAYNLANVIIKLGYSVLLVDMDTKTRAQAFMSKDAYEAVHSSDTSNASLKMALNNPNNGVGRYVSIITPGFHVLTMGLAGDIASISDIENQKMLRFANSVRGSYNFVIYDMPFNVAINICSDITYTADNIIIAAEAGNWGITKLMIDMSNIDNSDMQEVMFERSQVCLTKCKEISNILGKKVKAPQDILRAIDYRIKDLLGLEPEYLFENMSICGMIPYDNRYDNMIFSTKGYTDLSEGMSIYTELLEHVLLKR